MVEGVEVRLVAAHRAAGGWVNDGVTGDRTAMMRGFVEEMACGGGWVAWERGWRGWPESGARGT